jgi:predicted transglutaminase-like cysteine proteinase
MRTLVAAILLMFATPVIAATTDIPIDQAARNRFPNADKDTVDTLAFVNRFYNHSMAGVDDEEHYGVGDAWVSNPKDFKGDCEDYATTKLVLLENIGFPVVSNTRLRFVYIKDPSLGEGNHVVLEVKLNDGSIAVLDNLNDELMTETELKRTYGYHFYDW